MSNNERSIVLYYVYYYYLASRKSIWSRVSAHFKIWFLSVSRSFSGNWDKDSFSCRSSASCRSISKLSNFRKVANIWISLGKDDCSVSNWSNCWRSPSKVNWTSSTMFWTTSLPPRDCPSIERTSVASKCLLSKPFTKLASSKASSWNPIYLII